MSGQRSPVVEGGCQCGAVRYAFYAPPEKNHVCHCRMCQRATGVLFAALAGAQRPNFAWTRGTPAEYASSNLATRCFCAACGTPLTFAYTSPEARIYVTIGSMDDPEAGAIERQFGVESRLSWVTFCEDVPKERTGESTAAQEFLASLQSNQDPRGA